VRPGSSSEDAYSWRPVLNQLGWVILPLFTETVTRQTSEALQKHRHDGIPKSTFWKRSLTWQECFACRLTVFDALVIGSSLFRCSPDEGEIVMFLPTLRMIHCLSLHTAGSHRICIWCCGRPAENEHAIRTVKLAVSV
jgi:hypothetical protein